MLRNRRNRYDFMGEEHRAYPPEQRMQPLPPISQLDAQTERLAEQAEDIGWLKGQNDLLNEDNQRLEQTVKDLEERNRTLQERNTELERKDARGVSAEALANDILDAVKTKKGAK